MLRPGRELLELIPKVLRARDFHLYLKNGKRLTDLWLDGGRAVLGHKPPRVLLELKNAAERGLFCPLPHPMERRLLKALETLFPGRAFRLYADSPSLYRALAEAGMPLDANRLPDPAFPEAGVADNGTQVSLWRPFIEPQPAGTAPETSVALEPNVTSVLIPILPWPLGPDVLVLNKCMEALFPIGDLIPPVLLAPAARALYNLAAALKAPGQGHARYQKIEKVFSKRNLGASNESGKLWRRKGIYLTVKPGIESEKYAALFRRFLEGGFLIPPSPTEPVILPALMSPGEEAKLAELLKT